MPSSQNKTQPADRRIRNFDEVSLGLSKQIALREAQRCPQCANPVCMDSADGCPLGIAIPSFIRFLREDNLAAAAERIREKNPFPGICGRICSAPCEINCILQQEGHPIAIRALERFVADHSRPKIAAGSRKFLDKKIAVIGSGPCGLSAAKYLSEQSYQVVIYEALAKPGGILRYGVPHFRIPSKVLDTEIHALESLGVEIRTNYFVGQTVTMEELQNEYDAVLIATGAGTPKFMDLKGANLSGVYYGEEFLMQVNLLRPKVFAGYVPSMPLGDVIAVVGSGNTALDCARAARRFGKEVKLIFRRTEEEMRVKEEDRIYAEQEGVVFEPLTKPVEILDAQGGVAGIKCVRMDYADVNGKWDLVPVPESEFVMEADQVILAIGHQPNSLVQKYFSSLKLDADATIAVDAQTGMTNIKGIFAAGNVVTGAAPLIRAMAAGVDIAKQIHKFLQS